MESHLIRCSNVYEYSTHVCVRLPTLTLEVPVSEVVCINGEYFLKCRAGLPKDVNIEVSGILGKLIKCSIPIIEIVNNSNKSVEEMVKIEANHSEIFIMLKGPRTDSPTSQLAVKSVDDVQTFKQCLKDIVSAALNRLL